MNIRKIQIEDYEKLVLFWEENYFISEMDSKDRFVLFLEKNPGLSILAEKSGSIMGTALGSYDGRRGYIQKVVVDKNQRKNGIGQQLVEEVLLMLKALGAVYVPIAVEENLVNFYQNCGFKKTDQVSMGKDIK